jgi:ribosomal protein S3AE
MSGNIYSGKIVGIDIKGKYLVVKSKSQSSHHKDHFAIEISQAIGYKLSGEDITFYFKDFPNLQLLLNSDLTDKITEVLKKIFPMQEVHEQKINLFD